MRKSLYVLAIVLALTLPTSAVASVGGYNPPPQVSVGHYGLWSFAFLVALAYF